MKKQAQILHFDSYWKRQEKYDKLNNSSIEDINWQEIEVKEPYYFFVPKDFGKEEKYNQGFSVSEIFNVNNSWVKTDRDSLFINIDKSKLQENFEKLLSWNYDNYFIEKYRIKDSWSFKITERIIWKKYDENRINLVQYRPFDYQYIYYDQTIVSRPWFKVWKHIIKWNNFSLIASRQFWWWNHFICFASNKIVEISSQPFAPYYQFPLYLYNQKQDNLLNEDFSEKTPNLNWEIINKIEEKLAMPFIYSVDDDYFDIKWDFFTPEDLFDYIYAVLHSKSYRETYKEFLKIDFPKIPFDIDKETFSKLVKLWRELRSYHLMENENLIPKNFITKYPIDWNNEVGKVKWEDEKVFINDTQNFEWVTRDVWDFYIWWYQPAQKWLKDRKWRNLSYEDILHYSKIVLCLKETIRIMEEIEGVFKV